MGKLYGHFEEIAEHFREGDCWYEKHVAAMTEESLHYKSHIAAELAYRDMKNDQLEAALKRIVEANSNLQAAFDKGGVNTGYYFNKLYEAVDHANAVTETNT